MKILSVFGTRPEAIKMAPIVCGLARFVGIDSRVCVTGQHRQMLDQVLDLFDIKPNYDLNIMQSGQDLTEVTNRVMAGLKNVLKDWIPDWILVHGDTTTAMAAALAGYYSKIPVGHVEAGLRTGDIYSPWPEEVNRRIISTVASVHFAPTPLSKSNLIKEGVNDKSILVTGNTVIDALQTVVHKINNDHDLDQALSAQFSKIQQNKKLILVTGHRRENFGAGLENICNALIEISKRSDVQIAYPVHLNPNVQEPVNRLLRQQENVHLFQPLDYVPFVYLMMRSYIVLTDSGGIQEEALSVKKPVLVLRDTTERPEALKSGAVKLIGTDKQNIVNSTYALLDNPHQSEMMVQGENPYGDGNAAKKIIEYFINKQTPLTGSSD